MVKQLKIKVPPKGTGKSKKYQKIYLNTRVKKAMGCWHPNYIPKVHRYKYLHGSVMMACGYQKWVVWWDDGYNWNRLYTGAGYHSAGLKVCDHEDVQSFSDIPVRERVQNIVDMMDYELDESEQDNQQDLPTGPKLAFTKNNAHARFVHFSNTVTPTKTPDSTPVKTVRFDNDSSSKNLFSFSLPESPKDPNNQHDDDTISDTSQHSYIPDTYTIDKSKKVN